MRVHGHPAVRKKDKGSLIANPANDRPLPRPYLVGTVWEGRNSEIGGIRVQFKDRLGGGGDEEGELIFFLILGEGPGLWNWGDFSCWEIAVRRRDAPI